MPFSVRVFVSFLDIVAKFQKSLQEKGSVCSTKLVEGVKYLF